MDRSYSSLTKLARALDANPPTTDNPHVVHVQGWIGGRKSRQTDSLYLDLVNYDLESLSQYFRLTELSVSVDGVARVRWRNIGIHEL